jgi:ribosomal protein L16 Arg81 hydroxylase
MFENLGQVILQDTNLLYEDKPHLFKNAIPEYSHLASWQTVEYCLNNPQFYNFELIDKNNNKIQIPEHKKAWVYERTVQDKAFMFDSVNKGNSLVISNYTFVNNNVNELMNTFENLFDVHAAGHLYCGYQGSNSFHIHDDYPVNWIIQVEGNTRWKVFNNRISYLYQTGTMNGKLHEEQLDCAIDTVLEPGDMLYIPSRTFHVAYPSEKRISLSVPCWNRLPSDLPGTAIDRSIYTLGGIKNG